jgi:hypothetical protein
MTAGAQDIHRAVDDFAHDHMTRLPPRLAGAMSGSASAHSSSVRSLG